MKNLLLVSIFILEFNFGFSQELPKNPQPEKCYIKCFTEANKNKTKYKVINCSYLKPQPLKVVLTTNEALSKKNKKHLKKIYNRFLKKRIKIQFSVYLNGLLTYEQAQFKSNQITDFFKTLGASEDLFYIEMLKDNKMHNQIMYQVDLNSYFTNHH